MNAQLCEQTYDNQIFQVKLFQLIGKCHLDSNQKEEANEMLEKALQLNSEITSKQDVSNLPILSLIADYNKQNEDYLEAEKMYNQIWEITKEKYG